MRGAHNRLGFAVQLGTARFLGAFLDDPAQTPPAVITAMARQLGESSAPCLDAYRDGRQRWRHALAIREHYGFRNLEEDTAAGFRLTRWLYVLCWTGDDRPGLLFDRATTWLLAHKVLLPGITTLERLISRVRYRATLRLWHRLTYALSDEQRQKLVALVTSDDATLDTLDDLRAAPKRRTPTELLRHLDRIDVIRGHGLGLAPFLDLPAAPLGRLARSARSAKLANLAALHEPRRTATLAALFQTLEATALDDAVELFDALAGDIVTQAEEAHRKSRLRSLRDLDAAAIMLRDVGHMSSVTRTTTACRRLAGCLSSRLPGPTSRRPWPASTAWSPRLTTGGIGNCARSGGACARCSLPCCSGSRSTLRQPASLLSPRWITCAAWTTGPAPA